jgi:hypothetical protein
MEERNADLEERRREGRTLSWCMRDSRSNWHVGMQNWKRRKRRRLISRQLWRRRTPISRQLSTLENEKADLEATLEKEKADLEAEVLELELEHKQEIKEIYDLYNEELQENMGQHGRILELEEENNEELKDQMAMMATEVPVAGFGGDRSAEEQVGWFVNLFWRALRPPHMPQSPGVITWAHGMELEPPEPPRAAVMGYGPEKLSRPAGSTERRWGAFLPVPSRGAR